LSLNSATGEINLSTSIPGTYTVTYTIDAIPSSCQISSTSTAVIFISNPVEIIITGECVGVNYIVTANPVGTSFDPSTVSYSWENSTGLSVGDTQSITVTEEETYTVTVVSSGCNGIESFTVDAITCVIQKGISPNGDDLNDTFDLRGLNVRNLGIFNRFGTKVYSRKNYTDQWGGQTDKGEELPDGTYYFVIERDNGETKTGWIYINREI
jgi:gliding motility-associated-like protein